MVYKTNQNGRKILYYKKAIAEQLS